MASSCKITPTVKVGNEEKDSKLFKELTSFTKNREIAKQSYAVAMAMKDSFESKNELGEPSITEVIQKLNLNLIINTSNNSNFYAEQLGVVKNGKDVLFETSEEVVPKIIEFNDSHPNYVASISNKGEKYAVRVETSSFENLNAKNEVKFESALNTELVKILRGLGLDVRRDATLKQHGYFDPIHASRTADGLLSVITLDSTSMGDNSFVEEFSHVMIAGLKRHPIVLRLLSQLNEEVIQSILGDKYNAYNNLYDGNMDMLKEEAAGQLLASSFRGSSITESFKATPILDRLKNFIKSLFSREGLKGDLNRAVMAARSTTDNLAMEIKEESILKVFSKKDMMDNKPLAAIAESTDKKITALENAINTISKKVKIIEIKSLQGDVSEVALKTLEDLQKNLETKQFTAGCMASLSFINKEITDVLELRDAYAQLTEASSESYIIGKAAKTLNAMNDIIEAYSPIVEDMMSIAAMDSEDNANMSEEDKEMVATTAAKINTQIANLKKDYIKFRLKTVTAFLKPYWSFREDASNKDIRGKMKSLEMLLELADKDINGIDRWISSLGQASDELLAMIDKIAKYNEEARDLELKDLVDRINLEEDKLNAAGYDSSFMYERDKEGKLTGRLISDIDFLKYEEDKEKYYNSLVEGKLPSEHIRLKMQAWENEHTEEVMVDLVYERTETLPLRSLYHSKAIENLSEAQKGYYTKMMKYKAIMDNKLPKRYIKTYNAIMKRNDAIDAMTGNTDDAFKIGMETIADKFIRRGDDDASGFTIETKDKYGNIMADLKGKPIKKLPVYYTHKLEDMSRLSTDFGNSIKSYGAMALNYYEASKIIDVMELTKALILDREVQQYSGDNKLQDTYNLLGKTYGKPYTIKGSESKLGARLEDFFEAHFYGRKKMDEGTFKFGNTEVDTAKSLDALKGYTGILGLGLNTFSGISNAVAGKIQMSIEAAGGRYFNFKDLTTATAYYYKELPDYLSELNSKKKRSNLSLLLDRFDPMEEFYEEVKNSKGYSNAFARAIGNTNVFILNNLGEHLLHSQLMIAILKHTKINNGTSNMFDAFTSYVNKDGITKLILKDGSVENNGTKLFTLSMAKELEKLYEKEYRTEQDNIRGKELEAIKKYTEKRFTDLKMIMKSRNHALNGAFNSEDRGSIQRYALGRLAMQFRQWMPGLYFTRFQKRQYDALLQEYDEGYYRTLGRFFVDTLKDLRRHKFQVIANYKNLKSWEKANLRKAGFEMSVFVILSILCSAMAGWDDKNSKKNIAQKLLYYTLLRMKLETGAAMPFNPAFFKNGMTLLQSPAASIKSINNLGGLFCFWNMFDEIKSGKYKGWSEYTRDLYMATPLVGQIKKVVDLESENYMFNILK